MKENVGKVDKRINRVLTETITGIKKNLDKSQTPILNEKILEELNKASIYYIETKYLKYPNKLLDEKTD